MDSLIPEEFVGRCVASADMMCATSSHYDYVRAQSAYRMGVRMTASEIQHQYEQRVKEHEALEHERKIRGAQKNPLNRLLRRLKKACGSPVIEI